MPIIITQVLYKVLCITCRDTCKLCRTSMKRHRVRNQIQKEIKTRLSSKRSVFWESCSAGLGVGLKNILLIKCAGSSPEKCYISKSSTLESNIQRYDTKSSMPRMIKRLITCVWTLTSVVSGPLIHCVLYFIFELWLFHGQTC